MLFNSQSFEQYEVKLIFHGNCSHDQAVETIIYIIGNHSFLYSRKNNRKCCKQNWA